MKHKYCSLFFLAGVICANVFAQPVIKAQQAAGGSSYDFLTSMYLTTDGGIIAGGRSASDISGDKTQKSRGGYDYWIIKLDSSHNIQWNKTIGGDDFDGLSSLQQTSDGGYMLGGSSWSNISGEKSENNRGYGLDYWIVKLNKSGKIEWDKTLGGVDWDELHSLQQTADGGYILGGSSTSRASYEKTEEP